MPKEIDDCVESVMEENPDYSESRAYAICWAQKNKGNLGLSDNPSEIAMLEAVERHFDGPCWEGYTMVGMKRDENGNMVPNCVPDDEVPDANLAEGEGCPEGTERIAGFCVDTVDDVPPGSLDMSAPRILSQRQLAGPIERQELEDGSVRYTNIMLLSEGVWTDQNSKQPTHYDPSNLSIAEDNAVNIAHDDDNEVSEVGRIDAESAYVEDGDLYADVVLHMENAASEYADENLKTTLETDGQKGFGGPSVEIPPEGLEIEQNAELGYPKVEDGRINGLGLVKNPASKPTAFSTQTANREVALSDAQTDKALLLQKRDMSEGNPLESPDEAREILDKYEIDVDEMTDEDVLEMVSDLYEDLMDPMEEGNEMEEYEDDEDEEEETEMQEGAIDSIEEQIDDIWGAIDELKQQMSETEEEMSEELSDAKEELAAAENVAELRDAADELEKRLSAVEDEEKEPRTLAEGNTGDDGFDWSDPNDLDTQYDPSRGSTY